MIRHNLDVMHTEKNVFDNIFNTVLNVPGKTKDHAKSREELNDICNRPDLAFNPSTGQYPKAIYALDKNAKQALLEWVKELKFPDGHVSNLGRCVDLKKLKMNGMKSHDCHVFMQRLLPIAFREFLHPSVWEPITELSIFFKDLTCTTLKEDDLIEMEKDIAKILCKLERIFPPSFFDSMEHLPIHLPYEAKLAGPVQYRWIYLRKLKRKVTNKAKVEGSIATGYLYEEIAKFASFYFNDGDPTLPDRLQRNETRDDVVDDDVDRLSIFKPNGRPIGASKKRSLEEDEYTAAHSYILLNCPEIEHYKDLYVDELYEIIPGITQVQVEVKLETEFASWFERYAQTNYISNPYISSLAKGPLRQANHFQGYFVNGFKFQTKAYGENQLTMNSGVCVKGSLYAPTESDFYGILTDVLELEYPALPIKRTVLFKCNWFDPTDRGMSVHPRYNIVDVNHKRKYGKYEPFILAGQSGQVHYCTYPSKKKDKVNWWTVCKMRARSEIDMPDSITPAFQEDIIEQPLNVIPDDGSRILVDPVGEVETDVFFAPPEVEDEEQVPSISDEEDILEDDNDDD
ncbi:uncharacterized protein LOC130015269 [Mercurialis annua]|uniref:uncharacterized protein LOC130015269 n=1 Tax=Mercurialis annua TaxID=3986 RepID=UPI0024AD6626|nr:uncharacterized protein LOC130015269 [Mercurialis annua]